MIYEYKNGTGIVLSSFQKAVRAPSRVTGLSLNKAVFSGRPALRVNWTTPQSDKTITKYQMQYRISGKSDWGTEIVKTGFPPPNSTILTGLNAGTDYDVHVRAVSSVETGMWSAVQTQRTYMCEFDL